MLRHIYSEKYSTKKLVFLFVLFSSFGLVSRAQNKLNVLVKSEDRKQPLSGASVVITTLHKGASTDSSGLAVFTGLPNGTLELLISFVGYTAIQKKVALPIDHLLEIDLEEDEGEDNPNIVITTTRT